MPLLQIALMLYMVRIAHTHQSNNPGNSGYACVVLGLGYSLASVGIIQYYQSQQPAGSVGDDDGAFSLLR